eukprot:887326-Prorocentrum_minimum.AAC.2
MSQTSAHQFTYGSHYRPSTRTYDANKVLVVDSTVSVSSPAVELDLLAVAIGPRWTVNGKGKRTVLWAVAGATGWAER